jgi:adenine-specific DNA-methyltransferase
MSRRSEASDLIYDSGAVDATFESSKVYTPYALARAVVEALRDHPNAKWLEPSHGEGVFLKALADVGVERGRIRAIDLDKRDAENDQFGFVSRGVDFLDWAGNTRERFDRIVGNPPYLAIRNLPPGMRERAASIQDLSGSFIGAASNVWYAFVVRAVNLLREGGALAFVLPSAAEYADYSRPMRESIRQKFSELEVFRCKRPLFDSVQEGTVVAIARGYKECGFRFARKLYATPERLISGLTNSRTSLAECPTASVSQRDKTILFSKIGKIRLGGVTGDAKYFVLTEKERQALKLPVASCKRVLTRARHLCSSVVSDNSWDRLRCAGERVWLFHPRMKDLENRYVSKYLLEGECNRSGFKVRSREPWYSTPLPSEVHGFMSGMSRFGPWICINQSMRLNATNTLYVITFDASIEANLRFAYALALLTSAVQKQLRKAERRYADGLRKFEPGAIARLALPVPPETRQYADAYSTAVDAMLCGERLRATAIADGAFGL